MKPKSNYSRPMAAIYIIISFLATLIVLEFASSPSIHFWRTGFCVYLQA